MASSQQPWSTVRTLLKTIESFFDNYHQFCRDPSKRSLLRAELGRIRHKFQEAGCLEEVCTLFHEMMSREGSLIRLTDLQRDYFFFGDLHGSLTDMVLIWRTFWHQTDLRCSHYVFLGDYVDRGIHGFELTIFLILMKLCYPSQITLLRGNHEFPDMNRYSFLPECQAKFGPEQGRRVWRRINDVFAMLPYVVVIGQSFFCCHGGIPKNLVCLSQIEAIPKGLNQVRAPSLVFQLIWNDFYTESERIQDRTCPEAVLRRFRSFMPNQARGAGYLIGDRGAEAFFNRFRISYVVRGHQFNACVRQGYDCHQVRNGSVITLFSNSAYAGSVANNTAYLYVSFQKRLVQVYPLVRIDQPNAPWHHSELLEEDESGLAGMKFRDPFCLECSVKEDDENHLH